MLFAIILVLMKILLNGYSLQTLFDSYSQVGKSSRDVWLEKNVPHTQWKHSNCEYSNNFMSALTSL